MQSIDAMPHNTDKLGESLVDVVAGGIPKFLMACPLLMSPCYRRRFAGDWRWRRYYLPNRSPKRVADRWGNPDGFCSGTVEGGAGNEGIESR